MLARRARTEWVHPIQQVCQSRDTFEIEQKDVSAPIDKCTISLALTAQHVLERCYPTNQADLPIFPTDEQHQELVRNWKLESLDQVIKSKPVGVQKSLLEQQKKV